MKTVPGYDTKNKIIRPLITNIQRYSLQDGPGIRTTVFLKGCSLRCPWCHNPEAQRTSPEVYYNAEKCIGCAKCAEHCPTGATYIERDGMDSFLRFDREKCTGCGECVNDCLTGARELIGQSLTIDEIVKEATADRLFFLNSGGGITISGGDPLYFPHFTIELAQRLKNEHVHLAVETAAFCQWTYLEQLVEYIDLFLIDIKTMDAAKYKKHIKGELGVILKNLENLLEKKASVRVRLPIISGFNDSLSDYEDLVNYLGQLRGKIASVDILPFHSYGEKKYQFLGRYEDYQYRSVPNMTYKPIKVLVDMLTEAGFLPGVSLTVGGLIGVKT
ncbi:glycyl-radical enzyme activating protein [Paradesulfitobacterium aromaticivorans]